MTMENSNKTYASSPSKEKESGTNNSTSDSESRGVASDRTILEFQDSGSISHDFSVSALSDGFRSSSKETLVSSKRLSYQFRKPSDRKVNSLDGFTINRLNFGNSIYGRDTEIKQLNEALDSIENKKQLVLLAGYSGTGKTALAKTLQHRVNKLKGLYVEGKFDLNLRNEPYSALAHVCGAICARVLSLEHESSDTFRTILTSIEEGLGPELEVLLRVFPILEELGSVSAKHYDAQNPVDAKKRLNYAFCRLIRIIVQFFKPFVMVLDDLQWADAPSLDLLDAILMDRDMQMLVVGIYRSNEVNETHMLSSNLRDWRIRSKIGDVFSIREINVGNLDFEAVHKFVNDILSTSDTQTLGLASLCQKRTHGNVFFLTHFLRLLHRDQLLQYNFGTLKWTWDLHEIELKTKASDNVVDLLLQKMHGLPSDQSEILRVAACLGATFEEDTLILLLGELRGGIEAREDNTDEIKSALKALVVEGYLHEEEGTKYTFSHDKVEEAASLLTPTEAGRHVFHQEVGQTLLTSLRPKDLESAVFIVVNLLNEGDLPVDEAKRADLAQLNRRACTKAMTVSAFEAASNYASKGIALLGDAPFKNDCDLALDLFSTGAAAESCLGNTERMEAYCQAVMQETALPIKDKLRVYTTWLDSLANRGHMEAAAKETLRLLEEFGIRFPRSRTMQSLRTLTNIMKVKKAATKGSLLQDVLALPVEKDPTRIKLLHLMDRLSVYLFISHDELMPLVMFRNFEWTLKYGRNDVTPTALTTLGIIFAGILGDLQLGAEFAQTALKLIPKSSPLIESRTLFVAHGFVVPWTQPMRNQLKPLQRAYESGLCSGDAESACWAIYAFYHMRYLTSFSLDLCIADVETYMPQMKDLNQVVTYRSTVVNYQMFMNLAGRTETDPLSLVGEYCIAENHKAWLAEDPFYEHHCRIWSCYVRTLYGEHEECAKLAVKYGPNATVKSNPGAFSMSLFEIITKGVSSFISARQTGKKAYRKIAISIRKRIKDWIDKGNPNVTHFDAFFDAEFAALKGKSFAAIKSYQVAIIIAARGGLLLDAGLFSEVLGEYLLDQGNDTDEATFRLQEAIKYYGEFGAKRKVEMIERKHRELWPKPLVVMAIETAQ